MESDKLIVLMVEDNLDHIELARRAFELAYSDDEFYACTTLKQAQEWLQTNQPQVIIADLHLPDGSGLALLEQYSLDGKVAAVMITNQGDEHHAVQAIKHGAMDYLVKGPETFRRLPSLAHRVYHQWKIIEAKNEAEEKLRQHEALLNSILQSTRDGYLLIGADGTFLEVNRAYAELIGYAPDELIGKTIRDIEALQTDEQIAATLERIQSEGSALFETRHRHCQGHLIDVEVSVTYLPDQGGKMVTFVRDIRERLAMQTALQEAKGHIERQLEEMTILRNIDRAITSHQESESLIQVLLDQMTHLKGICAACLLLRDADGGLWKAKAAVPTTSSCDVARLASWVGLDLSLLAELSQIEILPLNPSPDDSLPESFSECKYVAILPLRKGQHDLGALWMFTTDPKVFDQAWRDFANSLAMQTVIALESVRLYEQLRQQHEELVEAYQATLEAWSRTLEIRDKETQGHTVRVVEISIKLAAAFGYAGEKLEVFRRGAMLHDIGKIRIPDAILLKPAALNDEEWIIMRQHPLYAREMLQGIRILENALEIPLYHHEHWDGSGYPFGLKGEAIPLSARIFAVADVWDALTSERPYRSAWTREVARQYIGKRAGKQFDPQVVEVFLAMLDKGEIS